MCGARGMCVEMGGGAVGDAGKQRERTKQVCKRRVRVRVSVRINVCGAIFCRKKKYVRTRPLPVAAPSRMSPPPRPAFVRTTPDVVMVQSQRGWAKAAYCTPIWPPQASRCVRLFCRSRFAAP